MQFSDDARMPQIFTPELLASYCAALGIDLFDPRFYGPRGFLLS